MELAPDISSQDVNPVAVSPVHAREAVPPASPSLVLHQCDELLTLQESLIISTIKRRREQVQRHETSIAECEDVYSRLDVSNKLTNCKKSSTHSLSFVLKWCSILQLSLSFAAERETETHRGIASFRDREGEGSDGTN